jgi:hypothetical protein
MGRESFGGDQLSCKPRLSRHAAAFEWSGLFVTQTAYQRWSRGMSFAMRSVQTYQVIKGLLAMYESVSKRPISLSDRARDALAAQPYFRGASYPIDIQSFDNVLVVTGRVPSYYLKQLLQSEFSRIEGVQRVENRVEVDYQNLGS